MKQLDVDVNQSFLKTADNKVILIEIRIRRHLMIQ